ncbi:fluoride efflux transporter CrcB [Streptomyces sp. NBC_01803]|uniref:fluoride efflux transporter CrcB n=1 Tax=Streptomyces sp. NBC_01803 TaxID=2975946 RepID=UPI002DDC14D4|nr:fluoride efflux transporter CrcB [Streptomyces sp. NBC_01803]WSA45581.1 fluoride efflux transporter CrcB [Streptomyces sp. NBC_01803]
MSEPDPVPRRRPSPTGHGQVPVLAAVALGGGLGSAARYGALRLWPVPAHAFPWTTLAVNAVGCALIGVLMVTVTEGRRPAHRLVRPFLGTGVLGGFTTFSTYTQDTERLLSAGRAAPALVYLAGTLAAALAAVWLASAATRRLLVPRRLS